MSDADVAVARHLAAYGEAVFARDSVGLALLYDERVRVFDAWGTWSYDGLDAWRTAIEQWLGALGDQRVEVRWEDVEIRGGADFALMHAIVTYAALDAHGQPLRAMQNRLTWALERAGDVWRIVHEHTSAPIDFAHRRAILRREMPPR